MHCAIIINPAGRGRRRTSAVVNTGGPRAVPAPSWSPRRPRGPGPVLPAGPRTPAA